MNRSAANAIRFGGALATYAAVAGFALPLAFSGAIVVLLPVSLLASGASTCAFIALSRNLDRSLDVGSDAAVLSIGVTVLLGALLAMLWRALPDGGGAGDIVYALVIMGALIGLPLTFVWHLFMFLGALWIGKRGRQGTLPD